MSCTSSLDEARGTLARSVSRSWTFSRRGRRTGSPIYHVLPDDDLRARAAIQAALGYQARGVLFDRDFSLDTEDTMYRTELVWRVYLDAGLDLLGGDFGPADETGPV